MEENGVSVSRISGLPFVLTQWAQSPSLQEFMNAVWDLGRLLHHSPFPIGRSDARHTD